MQGAESRKQIAVKDDRRRDVHGGGNNVVRGLALVDVVVGMDGRFAADLAAEKLYRAVGDHFIGVHVGRGARAGLVDVQDEMRVELAVDHVLRGLLDGTFEL